MIYLGTDTEPERLNKSSHFTEDFVDISVNIRTLYFLNLNPAMKKLNSKVNHLKIKKMQYVYIKNCFYILKII